MRTIDAQVHIWSPQTRERPWLEPYTQWAHAEGFTADDLLKAMDRAGVDGALLTGVPWDPFSDEVLLEAVQRFPDRFAALVAPNLHSPSNFREGDLASHLREVLGNELVAGTRFAFFGPTAQELDSGQHDWIFDELARAQKPTAIFAPQSLGKIASLAAARPGLKISLCHLGMLAGQRDPSIAHMTEQLLDLAGLGNISLKATGLPVPSIERWPFNDLQTAFHLLLDAYGPERVFWGTDLTRMQRDGWSYDSSLRFMERLDLSSVHTRDLLMGGGLARWLDWTPWT